MKIRRVVTRGRNEAEMVKTKRTSEKMVTRKCKSLSKEKMMNEKRKVPKSH